MGPFKKFANKLKKIRKKRPSSKEISEIRDKINKRKPSSKQLDDLTKTINVGNKKPNE